ncbi:prepilin-type N-terminal cleavage/methylation domain-containing protein [Pseudoalteromonas sp. C2R02]|uniref:PilW family protein n=1 Tax=Pseudoalteromonas sp. C2R02 TaxID=2841565 RepID=UPI001C095D36|nr:prepilin-type N-terminal cleavage/methylation domain-containing protein [Pseudoalteromonas sp. C2R02]MBU2971800.1 prepilin-type N-terminal cleavage/methylation domain-containing protein [Pseudoalteromonas sp. C2R02]
MFNLKKQKGYTLVELMIALLVGCILIMGVSLAYSSIKSLILSSKNIENAQEVLRFTAQTFTRSLKQTPGGITVIADQITIPQEPNSISCNGTRPIAVYDEIYSLNGNKLECDIGNGAEPILTGVENIAFAVNDRLVSITVTPKAQQGEPGGVGAARSMTINVALTRVILESTVGV